MIASTEDVLRYLEAPLHMRPAVGFEPDRLRITPAFDEAQVRRLESISRLKAPLDQRALERLLIDLSWASSHLEGNTYSQLDTQALIEWGEANREKPHDEAVMILNHKDAIRLLLESRGSPLTVDLVRKLHRKLADARDAQHSKHFLEQEKLGLLREYGDIVIAGSSYFPPVSLGPRMQTYLEQVVDTANASDPLNAAFYVMTRQPYLQPFLDVNKRTSRLAANLPLFNAGLTPFSFVGIEKSEYTKGIVAFYELGHESLLKTSFVGAYGMSALLHGATTSEQRVALANERVEIRKEVQEYVLGGKTPSNATLKALLAERGCEAEKQDVTPPPESFGM